MAGEIRIGVSGWRYTPWRGNFYPAGLAQARELEHAARIFSSIELNGSFYSLGSALPVTGNGRSGRRPASFLPKGARYITHMLKLRNAQAALANFFASGLFELGDKLGPILWQFPPQKNEVPRRGVRGVLPLAAAHDDRRGGAGARP